MIELSRTDLRIIYLTMVWFCFFANGLLWSLPNKIIVLTSDHLEEYENAREGFVYSFDNGTEIVQLNLQGRIDPDEQLAFSHALNREKPDLILCIGSPAAQFLSLSNINVPLVHTLVYETGHAEGNKSKENPFYAVEYELPPFTQLALIRRIFPDIERISCLLPNNISSDWIEGLHQATKQIHLDVLARRVDKASTLTTLLDSLSAQSDMLWIHPRLGVQNNSLLQYVLTFCISHRFPVIGGAESHIRKGAVLSLAANPAQCGELAAHIAKEIMQYGAPNKDVLKTPQEAKVIINKRMAKWYDLNIPEEMLNRADKIYY
jgi:putative ABC transport system substrate-binding protein